MLSKLLSTFCCRATDGWGNTVNELKTSQAWKDLHDVSAEEGLISIGYERKHGQWRYVYVQ